MPPNRQEVDNTKISNRQKVDSIKCNRKEVSGIKVFKIQCMVFVVKISESNYKRSKSKIIIYSNNDHLPHYSALGMFHSQMERTDHQQYASEEH